MMPMWKIKKLEGHKDDLGAYDLCYEIEGYGGDQVVMWVYMDEEGEIYEVEIVTPQGAYLFFGDEAKDAFRFVERELLKSVWVVKLKDSNVCSIEEEVGAVDNS